MRWPLRTPSTWQRHPSSRPTTTTDHPEEQMSTAATVAPCSALEKERVESRTTEGAADLRAELAQGLGDRLGPAVTMATTEHFNRCTGGTTCARETLTSLRRSIGSPPSSQVLTRPRMAPPLVLSEATLVREAGRSDGSRDDPRRIRSGRAPIATDWCAASMSVSTGPPPAPAAPTPASARTTCRS
jgi:hypothetical protein